MSNTDKQQVEKRARWNDDAGRWEVWDYTNRRGELVSTHASFDDAKAVHRDVR